MPSNARLPGPAMPSLSPEQAQKRLRAALEENGCHLTDDELRTAMARVGAPQQYDEAMMLRLVEEGLHCWARKDQTAAVTTALGMNHLGLEKDFEELKDKFNDMLGVLDEVMQISGISQDSNPRKKVEEMRGSLEKKVTEVKQTMASKAKHDKHDEWEGLTYEQAFQDPLQTRLVLTFDLHIRGNLHPIQTPASLEAELSSNISFGSLSNLKIWKCLLIASAPTR